MMNFMKKYFLTGLITLLPLAVTLWIVVKITNFLTQPFIGAVESMIHFNAPEKFIHTLSQILILLGLLLFTFLLGVVARRFFFRELIKFGDRLLHKIPLIRTIYKTSKDIIRSLFSGNGQSFKQVVLLPFPYKGAYCLGLITSGAPEAEGAPSDPNVTVFIPTTPNPTTGYLVFCRKDDLIYLDMKSEEAIKYIVSCGVIHPEPK
jgi:uncharacterized membrane protein